MLSNREIGHHKNQTLCQERTIEIKPNSENTFSIFAPNKRFYDIFFDKNHTLWELSPFEINVKNSKIFTHTSANITTINLWSFDKKNCGTFITADNRTAPFNPNQKVSLEYE
jgi:hypothetical protein